METTHVDPKPRRSRTMGQAHNRTASFQGDHTSNLSVLFKHQQSNELQIWQRLL